jgi:hypothetical protein
MIPKLGGRYHYRQETSFSLLIEITEVISERRVRVLILDKYPDNKHSITLGPASYSWQTDFGDWEYLEGQDCP